MSNASSPDQTVTEATTTIAALIGAADPNPVSVHDIGGDRKVVWVDWTTTDDEEAVGQEFWEAVDSLRVEGFVVETGEAMLASIGSDQEVYLARKVS